MLPIPTSFRSILVMLVLSSALALSLGWVLHARGVVLTHDVSTHFVLELVAVVISGLMFALVWVGQRETGVQFYLGLACGFLAVGLLDLAHALSLSGMPSYFTPNTPDKAIAFWLVARYVAAGLLLYIVWGVQSPRWLKAPASLRYWVMGGTLGLIVLVHWLVLYQPHWLPSLYVPAQGLSAWALNAEWGVVGLQAMALGLLLLRPSVSMRRARPWLACALFSMILSELSFIFYTPFYTPFYSFLRLAGEVFKLLAYLCLCWAIIIETLSRPYERMRAAHNRLLSLIDALPDPLFELDQAGRVIEVHLGSSNTLQLVPDELLGRPLAQFLDVEGQQVLQNLLAQAQHAGVVRAGPIAVKVLSEARYFELALSRLHMSELQEPRYLLLVRDVTKRQQNLEVLRRLQVAVDQSPSTIMITDLSSRLIYANKAFTKSTGYTVEEAMGATPRLLHSGKTPRGVYEDLWRTLAEGQAWRGELVNRRKDGSDYLESVLISPVTDNDGTINSYLAIKEDITEHRAAQERIRQLSHFDRLTGLPNRQQLAERFTEILSQARRSRRLLALISLGVDGFKQINETLGQSAGDQTLIEMARRLGALLRPKHLIARYSGDEFIAVVTLDSAKEAAQWVERMQHELTQPLMLGDRSLVLTASAGVAMMPDDGDSLPVLLRRANTALGQAKSEGTGRLSFFSSDLEQRSRRLLQVGSALRGAEERGELALVYQPKLDLATGQMSGVEALLRWQHPELGSVSPAEFIPVAEANGLIVSLGAWALREAVRQACAWQQDGLPAFSVAVNLSVAQVHEGQVLACLDEVLTQYALAPSLLQLELTESMAMEDPEGFLGVVAQMRARGVSLALDDFGTGYSSFSHLKRMNLSHLKIDKSFVDEITDDESAYSIVQAVIQMAQSLGMKTTAEGVETEEQCVVLRHLGCTEIQGYWYSRPLPPNQLVEFVRKAFGAPTD